MTHSGNGKALALRRLFLPWRRPALVVLLRVVTVCSDRARQPCHVYKPGAADKSIAAADDGRFSAQDEHNVWTSWWVAGGGGVRGTPERVECR